MRTPHIALSGKARSGKDTVAQVLVRHGSYTRLAFADELRRAALRLDPYIPLNPAKNAARLSQVIRETGWERAKDQFPEVRRVLQEYGQSVREMDTGFWIRGVIGQVRQGTEWNMPCVVTDVRYLNEVEELKAEGAVVVRVERPGAGVGAYSSHSSETALDGLVPDYVIRNDGTLAQLRDQVRTLYAQLGG
ncbi:hypothetical protein [Streptomyces sp. NPDC001828]|uniref:deoxynucleotide monophosphate kinase family protein n=1 Tax=Streptomyces sp. NPDC001828 TaxID=3364615 RepID=UPI00368145B6